MRAKEIGVPLYYDLGKMDLNTVIESRGSDVPEYIDSAKGVNVGPYKATSFSHIKNRFSTLTLTRVLDKIGRIIQLLSKIHVDDGS